MQYKWQVIKSRNWKKLYKALIRVSNSQVRRPQDLSPNATNPEKIQLDDMELKLNPAYKRTPETSSNIGDHKTTEKEIRDYSLLFTKLNLEENTPNNSPSKEEKDDNARTNNTSSQNQSPHNYT